MSSISKADEVDREPYLLDAAENYRRCIPPVPSQPCFSAFGPEILLFPTLIFWRLPNPPIYSDQCHQRLSAVRFSFRSLPEAATKCAIKHSLRASGAGWAQGACAERLLHHRCFHNCVHMNLRCVQKRNPKS